MLSLQDKVLASTVFGTTSLFTHASNVHEFNQKRNINVSLSHQKRPSCLSTWAVERAGRARRTLVSDCWTKRRKRRTSSAACGTQSQPPNRPPRWAPGWARCSPSSCCRRRRHSWHRHKKSIFFAKQFTKQSAFTVSFIVCFLEFPGGETSLFNSHHSN